MVAVAGHLIKRYGASRAELRQVLEALGITVHCALGPLARVLDALALCLC